MMMTRTASLAPSSSISRAIANQPALSKALTGGWSSIISAMPSAMVVLKGFDMCSLPFIESAFPYLVGSNSFDLVSRGAFLVE